MASFPCAICGDPNGFPFWFDKEPPNFCAQRHQWRGNQWIELDIKTVAECPYQMGKARQRAEWMKAAPEAFDDAGKMKAGMVGYVLEKWNAAYPNRELIL